MSNESNKTQFLDRRTDKTSIALPTGIPY